MITANDVIKLWESFEEEGGEQSAANLGAIPNPTVGVVTIQHPNRIRRKFKKSKNPWGYGDYLDKEEGQMSRASEFNRMFNEQGDVIMPGATTSEEPVVVDTPAEEPKPVDKGQILDRIKSAQMLLDGSFDTCISAIKKAKNDDDIRMALSVLKGAAVGVANGMQESRSRKIQEQDTGKYMLCIHYRSSGGLCGTGCDNEGVEKGDPCPFHTPDSTDQVYLSMHPNHQPDCTCYEAIGESRKKS
jgi:hypothetical protein